MRFNSSLTHNRFLLALVTRLSIVTGLLVAAAACKSSQDSSVKTLDAIASGGITKLYQCSGANQARITPDKIIFDANSSLAGEGEGTKAPLRKAVSDYFTAIDPSMQELFLKLGGNVLITDEERVAGYCRAARQRTAAGTNTGDTVHGCFLFVDDPTGEKPSIFTIVHAASPERIRYFGPQIFGYLYAQFYSRLGISKRQGASFSVNKNESMEFINYKELIADAFLRDMLASKKYNMNNLSPLLGVNADAELRAFAGDAGLMDALSMRKASDSSVPSTTEKERRRAQVRDYFFAHAFQSMNCNTDSLEVTRREFPRSLEAYTQVNTALVMISSELSGVASAAPATNDRFNLAAEPGSTGKALVDNKMSAKAGGVDLMSILSMVMPLLSQLGLPGGSGGLGGLGSLFNGQLGNNMNPGGNVYPGMLPNNGGYRPPGMMPNGYPNQGNRMPYNQGLLTQGQLAGYGNGKLGLLYNSLSNSGCPGGNCGGNSCSGGSCSGGECSSSTTTAGGVCEGAACADVVAT